LYSFVFILAKFCEMDNYEKFVVDITTKSFENGHADEKENG
jgi:hypothetical protein